MVAEGAIPCTKVTGKWLFPQAELDSWLSSYPVRPKGAAPPHPMPIVGGSHDPLAVHRQAATAARFPGLVYRPQNAEILPIPNSRS